MGLFVENNVKIVGYYACIRFFVENRFEKTPSNGIMQFADYAFSR